MISSDGSACASRRFSSFARFIVPRLRLSSTDLLRRAVVVPVDEERPRESGRLAPEKGKGDEDGLVMEELLG